MTERGTVTPDRATPSPSLPMASIPNTWAIRAPATPKMVVSIVLVGVLTDIVLHTGLATLSCFATLSIVAAQLLRSGRLENAISKLLVLSSLAFSVWSVLRTSAWLIALDMIVASALLLAGSSFSCSAAPWTTSIPEFLRRSCAVVSHGVRSGAFLFSGVKAPRRGAITPILRGFMLALPLLLILGALLASADAVFASFFDVNIDGSMTLFHLFGFTMGCLAMATLLRVASAAQEPKAAQGHRTLRRVEMMMVLGLLDGLFGLWAVAQLLAMSSAGDHVLNTQGLTYAEYARTGFFQLLAVAGITISIVMIVRAELQHDDPESTRWFRRLVLVLLGLTLAIVVVSIQRLSLYEREFGWTSLRLVVHISAVGIGVLVVLLALSCTTRLGAGNWFPSAAAVVACLALLLINLMNPDDFVTRRNVQRAPTTNRAFDDSYLARLSDDAIPAAVGGLKSLSEPEREDLLRQLCLRPYSNPDWLHWNLSARNADAAIRSLQCSK